ncbi:alpha/beta fold hydrolase [Amycolatopsis sp. BJA-103]|uniref:alpha/beta fold hydrolase n=1 Tax=Amycolatopsis sp. BJA-103 TaxID=1911175 RepID=UPI000C7728CC|nr:alpha/beta hydrolase [Amycolatopsis sp. BJA-103]
MYEKIRSGSRRKWRFAVGAVVIAAATLTTGAASATPRPDDRVKPAILLVHGAFADGSSWNGVATRPRHDGYEVTMAAVPLRGLTYDSAYIRSVLRSMPRKTIVAGHSYGGAVITNAAAGEPKAAGLVYVAAFAPDQNETVGALDDRFGGPAKKITTPTEYPLPSGSGTAVELTIAQDKFHHYFAQDVPRNEALTMAAGQRPVAVAAFGEVSGVPAWKTLPSWYVLARDDRMIPAAGQREMARRMNATVVERWASHAITVSQPGSVAEVIETAARRTRS